jgi:hypothetical protein
LVIKEALVIKGAFVIKEGLAIKTDRAGRCGTTRPGLLNIKNDEEG